MHFKLSKKRFLCKRGGYWWGGGAMSLYHIHGIQLCPLRYGAIVWSGRRFELRI